MLVLNNLLLAALLLQDFRGSAIEWVSLWIVIITWLVLMITAVMEYHTCRITSQLRTLKGRVCGY